MPREVYFQKSHKPVVEDQKPIPLISGAFWYVSFIFEGHAAEAGKGQCVLGVLVVMLIAILCCVLTVCLTTILGRLC